MNDIVNHPDFDQLLQLVDESAPSRSTRPVRKHVAACWKCRSHLEELEETVREFARYHEKVVLNLPAPPHPWPDLHAGMRQLDAENPLPDLWTRAHVYMSLPAVLSLKRLIVGGLAFGCLALALSLVYRGVKSHPAGPIIKPKVSAPASAPARGPVHALPAMPKVPTPTIPLIDTEVHAFAALHRIGADLGDLIEVASDSPGPVKVTGIGLASSRQAEVRDALASLPDVMMDFSHGNPAGGLQERAAKLNFEAGRSPFEARLQQFLGGQVGWERYTNQVLDESDSVLVRAHALHILAEHFPASRRASLRGSGDVAPQDFPLLNALYPSGPNAYAFLAKISPAGSLLFLYALSRHGSQPGGRR